MKNTITGADILKALLRCLAAKNLDFSRLVSITTDGAPSMVGKNKGVVSLLQKHMENKEINNNIVKLQCLIHQEALRAKVASLKNIMNVVLKTVNFILSRGLNHRQFRQLLLEAESQYGDLLHFCNVHWLSRGDMLQRVYRFREEILTFLEQKNIHRRLKRYPLQVRHKQDWGRGFILLLPQTAALPGSDAGSDVIKPASSFVIQNRQTSCSMWCPMYRARC